VRKILTRYQRVGKSNVSTLWKYTPWMTQVVNVIEPYTRHKIAKLYTHEHLGNGEIEMSGNIGLANNQLQGDLPIVCRKSLTLISHQQLVGASSTHGASAEACCPRVL
jgi:hypothetical protein